MQKHDIILIANEPWENFTWRRRHHVAWALAKEHRVLFVEPPYSLLAPLRDRHVSWRQVLNLGRIKHQGRNLHSYSPWKPLPLSLPFSEALRLEDLNRERAVAGVRSAARSLGFSRPILWTYFCSEQHEYHGRLGERLVVGDIYDKFTAPTWPGMGADQIETLRSRQQRLLRSADVVFAVSQALRDELAKEHPNVHRVANGVEIESYGRPEPKRGARGPVLAFLGMLHYKVDFSLLLRLARSRPDWTLLLIGKDNIQDPQDRALFDSLLELPNVRWTREVRREAIPALLAGADVGLVPLKKLEMNRYADLLKVYEYQAAGKPIVAIRQGSESDPLIRFAESHEGFERAVVEALEEDGTEELAASRRKAAEGNSWEQRTRQMLGLIEELNDAAGQRTR